jgi:F-type H+-transporting ATPase subunit epsilon
MAADTIELVVVTPAKQLLRRNVTEVTLPGAEGCIGVLPGHAPLITALGIGELGFRDADGREAEHLSVIRGFAEVLPNRVTLLAETAEFAAEIDLANKPGPEPKSALFPAIPTLIGTVPQLRSSVR